MSEGYSRFYADSSLMNEEDSLLSSPRTGFLDDDPLLLGGSSGLNTVSSNWRKGWKSVFRRGKEQHPLTSEERHRLSNNESIDYLPPNSGMYRRWLSDQPHRRTWDRWVMMGMIGCCCGLVGHTLYLIINVLADFKFSQTRWIIGHSNVALAWLFNVFISLIFIAASSAMCVGGAPEAIGSGIPEVMAYLNGIMMPRVFNVFTLIVKFFSCALAVASGLPVGPEGPLIHIGAALGSSLSQGHSTTMGFSSTWFKRFRNPKDKRDFVTAGVSVGVATAFNAPIGGLLFAFEEVASFWQQSLGWQVFFACMMATLTLNLAKSAVRAVQGEGTFGWFNQDVTFEVALAFSSHILAVIPAAVIGVVSGLLAVLFTGLNIKISRLRDSLMSHMKWRRVLEPCVLVLLWTTGAMVLPLFFHCTPTACSEVDGVLYCESGLIKDGSYAPELGNSTSSPGSQAPSLPLYTCRVVDTDSIFGNSSTWYPRGDSIAPDLPVGDGKQSTSVVYYNQLATLLWTTGEEGIKQLFARGTHKRFDYPALLVMGGYYFFGAALCAGSAISSGLFVPMLMIGAIIGRVLGLATVDIAQSWLGKRWSLDFGPLSWIDPGVFALVGAGAFMSGVTRLTLALAVIMIEISSDVHMLLPVLVAIMIAKWVADSLCHSLYHGLLEVKCIPFLPSEPSSKFSLDLIPVSHVMKSPVVTLRERMTIREVTETLRGVSHNGFPVVRQSSNGQVFVGLLTRSHVMAVLQAVLVSGDANAAVPWTELNRKMMDPVLAQRSVQEQQMAVLSRELEHNMMSIDVPSSSATSPLSARKSGGGPGGFRPGELSPYAPGSSRGGRLDLEDMEVDLTLYMNTSAFIVPDGFSVERVYLLFRTMGLRHLVVVDKSNHVKGIVTRKDLLGFRLDEALTRATQSR